MKREPLPYKPGQIVKVHPALDLWMRGVRYAMVTKVGAKWITIHDAMSNTTWRVKYSSKFPDKLVVTSEGGVRSLRQV
jgi:hypothetical protein